MADMNFTWPRHILDCITTDACCLKIFDRWQSKIILDPRFMIHGDLPLVTSTDSGFQGRNLIRFSCLDGRRSSSMWREAELQGPFLMACPDYAEVKLFRTFGRRHTKFEFRVMQKAYCVLRSHEEIAEIHAGTTECLDETSDISPHAIGVWFQELASIKTGLVTRLTGMEIGASRDTMIFLNDVDSAVFDQPREGGKYRVCASVAAGQQSKIFHAAQIQYVMQ